MTNRTSTTSVAKEEPGLNIDELAANMGQCWIDVVRKAKAVGIGLELSMAKPRGLNGTPTRLEPERRARPLLRRQA